MTFTSKVQTRNIHVNQLRVDGCAPKPIALQYPPENTRKAIYNKRTESLNDLSQATKKRKRQASPTEDFVTKSDADSTGDASKMSKADPELAAAMSCFDDNESVTA